MEEVNLQSDLPEQLEPEMAEVSLPRVSKSSHLRLFVNRIRKKVHPCSIIESLTALETLREVMEWTERYSQGELPNPIDSNSFGKWFAFYRDRELLHKSIIEESGGDPSLLVGFRGEIERELRFSVERLISLKPEVRQRYFRLLGHHSDLIEREVQQNYDEGIEDALSIALNGIPESASEERFVIGPGILYFAFIELPLICEGEESSQALFQRALKGDVRAIEILARKDRMIGADLELGRVLQNLRRKGLDEPFRKYLTGNGGKPAADTRLYQGYRVKCLFTSIIVEQSKRLKSLTDQFCGITAGFHEKLGIPFMKKPTLSIVDLTKYRSLKIPDVLGMLRAWSTDRGFSRDPDLLVDDDSFRRNVSRLQRFLRTQNWDISFQT